jgi:hypothetical protein
LRKAEGFARRRRPEIVRGHDYVVWGEARLFRWQRRAGADHLVVIEDQGSIDHNMRQGKRAGELAGRLALVSPEATFCFHSTN